MFRLLRHPAVYAADRILWATLLMLSMLTVSNPASSAIIPPPAEQAAILQVRLNHVDKGEIPVIIRPNDILVRTEDLTLRGLQISQARQEPLKDTLYTSLASMAPGLTYTMDEEALTLSLSATPDLLPTTAIALSLSRPHGIIYTETPSAFLNYAIESADLHVPSITLEAGGSLFGRLSAHSTAFYTTVNGLTRGLSTITLDDRSHLTRYSLGDNQTSTGLLGGGLLLGGFSISREYSLDPYFVRTPDFTLQGAVETPTTAEIYSNGTLLSQLDFAPGRFSLNRLPIPPGLRSIRLVLRDVFGRERTILTDTYFTSTLIEKGLHEYRYAIGVPRLNYGTTNFSYQLERPAFLAMHQTGLTDDLTTGGRLEATNQLISIGSLAATRWRYGEITAAAAVSRDHSQSGWAGLLSYTYAAAPFTLGAAIHRQSPHYATLSLPATSDRSLLTFSAFAGQQITDQIGVSLQYNRNTFRDQGLGDRAALTTHIRLTNSLSLLLAANRSTSSSSTHPEAFEVSASLHYTFNNVTNATVSTTSDLHQSATTLTLRQNLPMGEGYGYQLRTTLPDSPLQQATATVQYQGASGRSEATYSHLAGQDHLNLRLMGGIAAVPGILKTTRPIEGSFAIVSIPDTPNVRTYLHRSEIGRTDARGASAIPNLQPYYGNHISIADTDVPIDRQLDTKERLLAPPLYGGSVVTFQAKLVRAVTGQILIHEEIGKRAPTGGLISVTSDGHTTESPLGHHGEFYLDDVQQGQYNATVNYPGGHCRAILSVPASDEIVTVIGPVACFPTAPPQETLK